MPIATLTSRTGWAVAFLALGSLTCPAEVDFATEIKPILQNNCFKCHGPEKSKSGFRLDSRAGILKGGRDDVGIIPGNAKDSPLVHLVEHGDMPPEEEGAPLTAGQIAKLKQWINEGAKWNNATSQQGTVASKPEISTTTPAPSEGTTRPGLPPTGDQTIEFNRDIHPILERSCLKCHGPEKPKGRFRLDNRESALKGGSEGITIIPGNSRDSRLIHYVARQVDGMEMPPEGKGQALSTPEVTMLRTWIDQGAEWGGPTETPQLTILLTPTLRWISVNGNEQKFREHNWMKEGVTGGIERFTMEDWFDRDTKFTAEGSAVGPGNLDFTFALTRQDIGFIRGGAEQSRRYYNNYGGYYAPFEDLVAPAFRLDQEMHLDTGRIWSEFGLTIPRGPEIVLGYQYRFKDGTKPTLHWGQSTQGGETRKIYPAYQSISEDVHIFTADLTYDWSGLLIENNFMAEWANTQTQRVEVSPMSFGAYPDSFTTIDESNDSSQIANTFSLQKDIKEWWTVSGGYYYSKLEGDATFQQRTIDPTGGTIFGQQWSAQPIVLDWNAHIFNLSTRLGEWNGFTLTGGIQNQWQRQSAIGNSTLFFGIPDPMVEIPGFFSSTVSSNKQTFTMEEQATLRYDRIPHTILFAEAELEQETIDYFEQDFGFIQGFVRDTESSSRDQDYKTGFTYTPTSKISLTSHFRYRIKENDYDHLRDEAFGMTNPGYSAFILGRDTEVQEFMAYLNYRPTPWVRALLSYRNQNTDYTTDTDSVLFGAPSDTIGGQLLAGNYSADNYGLNLVLTPWERLALTASFDYLDSNTQTASNGDPAVDDFKGDIYSALVGGSYRLSDKTDVSASYAFSRGDFGQGNAADGLPLGIEYDQHAFRVGVSTQLSEKVRTQLQYQFQQYDEPTSGNINDYTAHGVFVNFTVNW